jgi:hypothetical protein
MRVNVKEIISDGVSCIPMLLLTVKLCVLVNIVMMFCT